MGAAARLRGLRAGVSQRISKLGLRLATPKGFASKPPRYTIAIEETHRYINKHEMHSSFRLALDRSFHFRNRPIPCSFSVV